MYNPYLIAGAVDVLRKKGYTFENAVKEVAKRYKVRRLDVRLVSQVILQDLWEKWAPNLRGEEDLSLGDMKRKIGKRKEGKEE